MEKQTFMISNISCSHCVTTIQKEVHGLQGVVLVNGNKQSRTITVEWQAPATVFQIKEKLAEIGYPASEQNSQTPVKKDCRGGL